MYNWREGCQDLNSIDLSSTKLRERSGKSARINEKIKKKLGIEVVQEATKEQVANENSIKDEVEKQSTPTETKSENPKDTNQEKK